MEKVYFAHFANKLTWLNWLGLSLEWKRKRAIDGEISNEDGEQVLVRWDERDRER